MVLTVTINPLLERRYYYPELNLLSVNRNGKVILKAGGKGINVNRQLNKLDVQNSALLFTGGSNGKLYRDTLRAEGINFSDLKIRNEIRDAAIIIDETDNKIFSFFGTDPFISSSEVDEFITKMAKAIATCEIVVFSGSSPCKESEIIFLEGIKIANELDKISVCDTYGAHLKNCLNASPTIIHNNIDEVRNSLGLELNSEGDFKLFLLNLYENGIKQAYITNAEKPLYASNFDFHYKATLPQISTVDSTGSGDAFVAGIVYGWTKKLKFEDQLKLACALGIINAQSVEVCDVEFGKAESIVNEIRIDSIGKKLKEINDSSG
jgi:1-phosphofructokinase family hexose kinase